MHHNKMFATTSADYALAAIILVLFAAPLLSMISPSSKPETAYIYKNNILAEKVSLKTDGIIRLEKMAFEVKSGRIRVSESDCKNHVCMEEGWIMNPGQSIVCLPNRVVVEIPAGSGDSKYDILSE
jgi:hypothetical protein